MDISLDIRQGIRNLRRHRGLTLAAMTTLGLGVGATLTMAGIVEHVLLRPLPVRDQDRVLVSWGVFQSSGFGHVPLTHSTMRALAEGTRVFEQLAGVDYNGVWADVGRVGDRAVPYRIGVVTGELFPTLGVAPLLGRTLSAEDDRIGAAPVAVLSEGLWQRRFGRDSSVLGKPFQVTTGTYTIVGVAPDDFDLPRDSDVWVTFAAINPDLLKDDAYGTLDLVGRLRPGRTMEDGRRELDRMVTEVDGSQWSADARLFMTVRTLQEVVVGQVRPAIWLLGAAALLVFLVAVLNLGNLLIVRGLERQREFAIRRAIGATRASLARHLVIETALMVALGGAVGMVLAWAAWRVLPTLAPADLPRIEGISVNASVLLVALGLGFFAVAVVSALPALSLRETDLRLPRGADAGASGTGSRGFAWSGAIAAQVTLAVVTLIASLLLVRTLYHLERLEPGFELEDLGLAQIALLSTDPKTTERGDQLVEQLVERIRAVPGVLHVTTTLTRPLSGTGGWDYGFIAEGQTDAQGAANPYLNYEAVMPNYFETLRLPLLRGRAFGEGDREGSQLVVIVSQAVGRLAWPGQDPIGKRIRWAGDEEAGRWRTVVGVVADTRYRDFLDPRPSVYVPAKQQTWGPGYLLIRTAQPFGGIVPTLRQATREVHPDFDLVNASPIQATLDQPLARPRFNAGVLLFFSTIAVTLTVVGLYGLTRFVVVQRRREVGIRRALGAESHQIARLFLRRGMLPVLAGAAAGVGIALASGQVLSSLLFGVATTDSLALVGAVVGFTLVALGAILLATREAARTDPMVALRAE
ncbi:MAG: ABC transporter permease [Gemmatimonadales bacterium]|nr:ABC transporter permease [Gemmatimonadales bacterium]